MRRILSSGAAVALVLVGGAVVAQAPALPAGWERVALAPASSARAMPSCCASDATCCERQLLIDQSRVKEGGEVITLLARDLPEATVHRAPAPGPGVPGAPELRIIDGRGQPPPWKDGAHGEIRLMPPGGLGDITRGEWWEPFFASPALRGQGYGVVHEASGSWIAGPYAWRALSRGPGDTLAYDSVDGELDAQLHAVVRTWIHADAAPIARGVLFAYTTSDEARESVHLVLPEVILGNVSTGVEVHGGFEARSRFSRSVAYTTYTIHAGPGAGEQVSFTVLDSQLRTLASIDRAPASPNGFSAVVDVSRLSTEDTARIRVHLVEED